MQIPFNEQFPGSYWTFYLFQINQTSNTRYGFRYSFHGENSVVTHNNTESVLPSELTLSAINPNLKIYYGSDLFHTTGCGCTFQYLRMYLNYVAQSQDALYHLAMMDPKCKNIQYFNFRDSSHIFVSHPLRTVFSVRSKYEIQSKYARNRV